MLDWLVAAGVSERGVVSVATFWTGAAPNLSQTSNDRKDIPGRGRIFVQTFIRYYFRRFLFPRDTVSSPYSNLILGSGDSIEDVCDQIRDDHRNSYDDGDRENRDIIQIQIARTVKNPMPCVLENILDDYCTTGCRTEK